ncbi:hypothetical protein [uncultured Gammaproteobacteria bacterium]|nr:hypothetical protein [uncultured Gammaproteobacteria bacterium]
MVIPQQEDFKFSEERRLFYVALTRAKEKLFILSNKHTISEFVTEVINDSADTEIQVFGDDSQNTHCPNCKTGFLIERNGKNLFYGCSNYPLCEHTKEVKYCNQCGELLRKNIKNNTADCNECGNSESICNKCNGYMVKRKGKYGSFMGCSNYAKTDCDFTINLRF